MGENKCWERKQIIRKYNDVTMQHYVRSWGYEKI